MAIHRNINDNSTPACTWQLWNDVKAYLIHTARLVYDGSLIDPRGLFTRTIIVKDVSVHLLDIISDSQHLEVLTGYICNACIQTYTKEKICAKCGPELGDRAGSIVIIVRALYKLVTSVKRFRTMLIDFLRTLDFTTTRFDIDV